MSTDGSAFQPLPGTYRRSIDRSIDRTTHSRPTHLHSPPQGHSTSGWVTDYGLFGLSLIVTTRCLVHGGAAGTGMQRALGILYIMATGLAYGWGGWTHHQLDNIYGRGDAPGMKWGGLNADWHMSWVIATIFAVVAPMFQFLFAVQAGLYGRPDGLFLRICVLLTFGLTVVLLYISVSSLLSHDADDWGESLPYIFLRSVLCALAVFLSGLRVANFGLALSGLATIAGWAMMALVPSSCTDPTTLGSDSCPFYQNLNQNVVFHCFIAVSLVAMGSAVMASKPFSASIGNKKEA